MNRRVSPWAAASGMPGAFDPAVCAAADSRARTLVVPTAITPPRARAAAMASTVACGTVNHSACMMWSSSLSTRTGWKVPAPTCSVTKARSTPRASNWSSVA